MLVKYHPPTYFEIGSGFSTLVAKQAIRDHNLSTRIVSIDPMPRAEIDSLCDETHRIALQKMDISFFEKITPPNILFVDGSHISLQNSDVSTFFLDILPVLQPGVIIQIHDILLPSDYHQEFGERLYSEQYLLAVYLMGNSNGYEILFPSHYVREN